MLLYNPSKRPTAAQALRYPFFQVGQALTTTDFGSDIQAKRGFGSNSQTPVDDG